MWYAVYRQADGELVSTGTSVAGEAELAAAGHAKLALGEGWSPAGLRWDRDTREFVAADAIMPTLLTPYQFLTRFTAAERIAIRGSADPVVVDFLDLLNKAREIDLADPATIAGVDYLAVNGLLGAERAAEILAP